LGRSPFGSRAKGIAVNQDVSMGLVEDRRHILHYDEVLKPNIERVISSLYHSVGGDRDKIFKHVIGAMQKRGLKRLPRTFDRAMERLVTEVNSASDNLVPDRADTNKAIEVVRGYVRKLIVALSTEEFAEDCKSSNSMRMNAYKKRAKEILIIDFSGGDITSERNRIHGEILEFINECAGPAALWVLLHDIVYSVTFDFSPKITRDATEKALKWEKRMRTSEDDDAVTQLNELLSIVG